MTEQRAAGERFTSWLSEEERKALRALAAEQGCSENFIVRSALRALLFGKEPSSFRTLQDAAREQFSGNVSNTSNTTRNHALGARS